jgi:WD40 repeat protein
LAVREQPASIFVRDMETAEWIVLGGGASAIRSVAWHPKADRLAGIDLAGLVYLCNTDNRQTRLVYQHSQQGRFVTWSPDGQWLASAGGKDICFITPDLTVATRVTLGPATAVNGLRWSPDGQWLAVQDYDNSIHLYEPDGTTGPVLIGENLETASLSWRHDGRHIACTTIDNTMIVWDANDGSTQWVGYALPEGKAAVVTRHGDLVTDHADAFFQRYVFVRRLRDGRALLSDSPFFGSSRPGE